MSFFLEVGTPKFGPFSTINHVSLGSVLSVVGPDTNSRSKLMCVMFDH